MQIGLGTAFGGNFDGGFHAIGNLMINRPGTDHVGLFSRQMTSSSALISNLRLADANVTRNNNTGAIFGSADWSLTDLWATGTIPARTAPAASSGPPKGYLYFDGSRQGEHSVGGFAGQLSSGKILEESFSTASVIATTRNPGDIVGLFSGTQISKVRASGAVTTPSSGGALGRHRNQLGGR